MKTAALYLCLTFVLLSAISSIVEGLPAVHIALRWAAVGAVLSVVFLRRHL